MEMQIAILGLFFCFAVAGFIAASVHLLTENSRRSDDISRLNEVIDMAGGTGGTTTGNGGNGSTTGPAPTTLPPCSDPHPDACDGGSRCTDFLDSHGDCGGCGRACPGNAVCLTGRCVCSDGYTECKDISGGGPHGFTCEPNSIHLVRCFDGTCRQRASATDPNNCGGCDLHCDAATEECRPSDHKCICKNQGEQECGSGCVDTRSDPQNCGYCGNHCAPGLECFQGICRCSGGDNSTRRTCGDGVCIDNFDSNPLHCGSCFGVCPTGSVCSGGFCDCVNATEILCDGRCLNTQASDINNCGACGKVCSAGTTPGCCGGACVDLSSDYDNCGTCGNVCNGTNVVCSLGQCALIGTQPPP